MREAVGYEDEAIVTRLTNSETGLINTAELWAVRLSKSVIEPAMGSQDVKALGGSIYNTLKAKWLFLNDPDPTAFLEPKTEK